MVLVAGGNATHCGQCIQRRSFDFCTNLVAGGLMAPRLFRRCAQRSDECDGLRAGPQPALLSPAESQGPQRDSLIASSSSDQRADAFGRIYLVATDAQQIDPRIDQISLAFAESLGGVDMEIGLVLGQRRYGLLQRLHDASFVIHVHDRNQQGLGPQCGLQVFHRNATVRAGGQQGHLVFKGGTSLSKVFGVIHRFSEDIDLSISPALLGIDNAWLEESATKTQRGKRMEKLEDLCILAVRERYAPLLEASIREELGPPGKLWKLITSVDAVTHSPVVLFE